MMVSDIEDRAEADAAMQPEHALGDMPHDVGSGRFNVPVPAEAILNIARDAAMTDKDKLLKISSLLLQARREGYAAYHHDAVRSLTNVARSRGIG